MVRNSLTVDLVHGRQIIDSVLAALVTLVHADRLVEGQQLLLILDVQVFLLLQLEAEGTYQLGHPDDHLVVLVIGLEQLQQAWDQLSFNQVHGESLQDILQTFQCLNFDKSFFVVSQLADLWDVGILEARGAEECLVVVTQILLEEDGAVGPDLVVGVGAHLHNQAQHCSIRVDRALTALFD